MRPPLLDAAAGLLGRSVRLVAALPGGTHAETVLVEVDGPEGPGGAQELVVRRFPAGDDAAVRERAVLPRLAPLGAAAPRLVAASDDLVVTTRVPGSAPAPDLPLDVVAEQMALVLARIHALDGAGLPERGPRTPAGTTALARACERAGAPDTAGSVLLHGDAWCGNALWQGPRLSGVVDWSGAGHGPRELDLAWCRQDLVLLGSPDAADTLVRTYAQRAGVAPRSLATWDLLAAAAADAGVETWAPNYAGIGRPHLDGPLLRARLDAWVEHLLAAERID